MRVIRRRRVTPPSVVLGSIHRVAGMESRGVMARKAKATAAVVGTAGKNVLDTEATRIAPEGMVVRNHLDTVETPTNPVATMAVKRVPDMEAILILLGATKGARSRLVTVVTRMDLEAAMGVVEMTTNMEKGGKEGTNIAPRVTAMRATGDATKQLSRPRDMTLDRGVTW